MKKISLDPETLSVQSFDTSPAAAGHGTVFGRATEYWVGTCGGQDSCNATYCNDCQDTNPGGDCAGGSGDCPSVNIAGCQSAFFTDCCNASETGCLCRYSADTYNPPGIGCT